MTCCLLAGPGCWEPSGGMVAACFALFELPRLLNATAGTAWCHCKQQHWGLFLFRAHGRHEYRALRVFMLPASLPMKSLLNGVAGANHDNL